MPEGINHMGVKEFEEKAMTTLIRLGYGEWRACWIPNPTYPVRGRAVPEKQVIEIFDLDEVDAWDTFIHEIIEIKMRSALRPYRILVNKLIEGYQEIVDGEKDRFIESLNEVFEVAQNQSLSS